MSMIDRRTVLAALPLACAVPALAAQDASPLSALYRRYRYLMDAAKAYAANDIPDIDAALNRLFYDEASQIEERITNAPINCPADLAIKVLVDTAEGEVSIDGPLLGVLKALVGGPAPLPSPTPVPPRPSPMMSMFREWDALTAEVNSMPSGTPDDDFEPLNIRRLEVDARVRATPCQSATDFVAKVVICSDWGVMGLGYGDGASALWEEASAFLVPELQASAIM